MNTQSLRLIVVGSLALCLLGASSAWAHYLWIGVDAKTKPHGTANIYFEEGPRAGDGKYLDPFLKSGQTWIRTINEPKPQPLVTKEATDEKLRWMNAELPTGGPRSIDSYGKFGVYAYGKTNVLLHYYARHLDLDAHEDLHELARAEQMALDIVPHDHAGTLELRVLWHGKPQADRTVYIRGPKKFQMNPKTDANGEVSFKIEHEGTYLFRTSVELDEPGTEAGEDYSLIRHHATLNMRLPLAK